MCHHINGSKSSTSLTGNHTEKPPSALHVNKVKSIELHSKQHRTTNFIMDDNINTRTFICRALIVSTDAPNARIYANHLCIKIVRSSIMLVGSSILLWLYTRYKFSVHTWICMHNRVSYCDCASHTDNSCSKNSIYDFEIVWIYFHLWDSFARISHFIQQ